jgi:hypothetical protein
MAAPVYEPIATATVRSKVANFTISSIPQTHSHLHISCDFGMAYNEYNTSYGGVYQFRFNGDSGGSNYGWVSWGHPMNYNSYTRLIQYDLSDGGFECRSMATGVNKTVDGNKVSVPWQGYDHIEMTVADYTEAVHKGKAVDLYATSGKSYWKAGWSSMYFCGTNQGSGVWYDSTGTGNVTSLYCAVGSGYFTPGSTVTIYGLDDDN